MSIVPASQSAVHPHVCGEHLPNMTDEKIRSGSSPRVWGTSSIHRIYNKQIRFIPTCVGNINPAHRFQRWSAVHPHVCGEHLGYAGVLFTSAGSSPRVWGTFFLRGGGRRLLRFIPTCVGNIPISSRLWPRTTVHPHVCGEHVSGRIPALFKTGSSPRVWGTLFLNTVAVWSIRFIPTCVGNICPRSSQAALQTVHPHVCGEHGQYIVSGLEWLGSSPRVWGT